MSTVSSSTRSLWGRCSHIGRTAATRSAGLSSTAASFTSSFTGGLGFLPVPLPGFPLPVFDFLTAMTLWPCHLATMIVQAVWPVSEMPHGWCCSARGCSLHHASYGAFTPGSFSCCSSYPNWLLSFAAYSFAVYLHSLYALIATCSC
ncbi:hypothetical protein COO60DRAFT_1503874 [Scenedesmus sp. NREL 46B-D3]|nr:hypothetical protein COO60DRAFT_1503874 [Scenedesmus sp. NREL 46B-D3]